MASRNDITGDSIRTKVTSMAYQDNYDRIFGKKNKPTPVTTDEDIVVNHLKHALRLMKNEQVSWRDVEESIKNALTIVEDHIL